MEISVTYLVRSKIFWVSVGERYRAVDTVRDGGLVFIPSCFVSKRQLAQIDQQNGIR